MTNEQTASPSIAASVRELSGGYGYGGMMTRRAEAVFEAAVQEYVRHRTADGWELDEIADYLSGWATHLVEGD